jgi:hypothetical protein
MKSPTLDRARYSSDLLRRVTAGWQQLANRERYGVLQAARITAELSALGAPPSILALAAHVVQEKVRHLEVCGRVIDELGARGDARLGRAGRSARPIELTIGLPRASLATEMGLARVLVSDFALGKPLTAASFATARAIVREPLMAWAYTELLHDETRHATFGAKAAAWVVRHWSTRQRQTLWASCLADTATPITLGPIDAEAEALGLLPAESGDTLPRWILPHLAPLSMASHPSNDQALLQ